MDSAIRLLLAERGRHTGDPDKILTERAVQAVRTLAKPGSCSRSPAAARRGACRCS